jgi:hypothetical protein
VMVAWWCDGAMVRWRDCVIAPRCGGATMLRLALAWMLTLFGLALASGNGEPTILLAQAYR